MIAQGYNESEAEFIISEYNNDPESEPYIDLNPIEIAKNMAEKVMGNLQE